MCCEQDTPYCDACHYEATHSPHGFKPCAECQEMLRHYCWACQTRQVEEVEDGVCSVCRAEQAQAEGMKAPKVAS